ncbi:hypothetical protein [Stieleria varia]|uniref:FHA domain-containing protein n=1 Tax=Stieleria varia TaxID=2528005 RepID=A0A5C6B881_9BACT|nr:hypothetical protein [Stieleria varia]TWU07499.1 hypothetical protein Pla52n_00720 [Stieleria varia]
MTDDRQLSDGDLLDQLDQSWIAGGPVDLAELLSRVSADDSTLAQELCAADLEWRWRADSPNKPSARVYASLLGRHWDDAECRRNLMEAEWCVRCVWGDAPDVDEFAKALPERLGWSSDLSRQLHALVPWTTTLSGASMKRPVVIQVNHDFVIGRQGAKEPQAPSWIASKKRLIVANSHFRIMSRDQLRVRRTRTSEIEITNISKTAPFDSEQAQLQPGESIRRPLPTAISIGEVNLEITLPSQAIGRKNGAN